MKKIFSKKYLLITVFALIFFAGATLVLLAAGQEENYYRVNKEKSNVGVTTGIATKLGTSTIINRSSQDFFVPNKTAPEYDAWSQNAPGYVTVSVCGDGVMGEGETSDTCPQDGINRSPESYCGDGTCNVKTIDPRDRTTKVWTRFDPPQEKTFTETNCEIIKNKWRYVPIVNIFVFFSGNAAEVECNSTTKTIKVHYGYVGKGEIYSNPLNDPDLTECKDDCAPPADAGCGVCGYSPGGVICPNLCNDQGLNLTNCKLDQPQTVYPDNCSTHPTDYPIMSKNTPGLIKKYLTAAEALAGLTAPLCENTESYSYVIDGGWRCDYSTTDQSAYLCPPGSYCPYTGGLKIGTVKTSFVDAAFLYTLGMKYQKTFTLQDLTVTCSAGHFCKAGSSRERPCPPNTWSAAGAAECTACPVGTVSLGGSRSNSQSACLETPTSGDGVCGSGETSINSPYDCSIVGDKKCSGSETMATDPVSCKCGDGYCNNGETYLSCMTDCFGFDPVCGTRVPTKFLNSVYSSNAYNPTYYLEKNAHKIAPGVTKANASDCRLMNDAATCGNNICETSEGYNGTIGRIVCPIDCSCGDNYCNPNIGEFYSPTGAANSCNLDCKCGNGSCDSNENWSNCPGDCKCGNGYCEPGYGESTSTCYSDCYCGDKFCSAEEKLAGNCTLDCNKCFIDGYCDSDNGENKTNCPKDCSTYMTPIE